MKKIILISYLVISTVLLSGQITLVKEGDVVTNSSTGNWAGVNIPRSEQTKLTYRNNSITSVNTEGYMLQAGDEAPGPNNNHLDGEVITGNKFVWNGVNGSAVITHGLFAGYNKNSVVKYNYLDKVPYGIIFKSGTDAGQNMTFTEGGCAYNIVRNGKFAGRVKGINGVKFINNTFYNGDGSGWYFILVTANSDRVVPAPSTGTKVFNNIFYSTTKIPMIKIESGSLSNFECDYNVYWSTAGEPIFNIDGATVTWAQWRARGYDAHSVIKNPDFINTTDLVPRARLDFGTDLGATWQSGLSTTASWVTGTSPAIANQNGTWQVGARIYAATGSVVPPVIPSYTGSVIQNATPAMLEMNFSTSLANIIPTLQSFKVEVNSVSRTVGKVEIIGSRVVLTLDSPVKYNDIVAVAYTKPATNPLQSVTGGAVESINANTATNNLAAPPVVVNSPVSITMSISPNNVHKTISIILSYSNPLTAEQALAISPQIIRISDVAGKLFVEQSVDTGATIVQFPINLQSGIYDVSLTANGTELATQKIRVY
jgi:hypothetical protein